PLASLPFPPVPFPLAFLIPPSPYFHSECRRRRWPTGMLSRRSLLTPGPPRIKAPSHVCFHLIQQSKKKARKRQARERKKKKEKGSQIAKGSTQKKKKKIPFHP